jgi:hypothetical protein
MLIKISTVNYPYNGLFDFNLNLRGNIMFDFKLKSGYRKVFRIEGVGSRMSTNVIVSMRVKAGKDEGE